MLTSPCNHIQTYPIYVAYKTGCNCAARRTRQGEAFSERARAEERRGVASQQPKGRAANRSALLGGTSRSLS